MIGVAAGMLSKSGKLGYVGSFPVPSVYSGTNAFLMGARTVNPDATVQVIMINSWFDPQAANQAGTALVDNGCDFLFGIMDEAAYLQVAEKRGVWAAMWNTDIRRYGPKAYVSSVILDWKPFYVEQARKRLAGEWVPTGKSAADGRRHRPRRLGRERAEGSRKEAADAVRDKILGGFSPFVGEIKDRHRRRPREGRRENGRDELYHWDWSIEGVSRHQRLNEVLNSQAIARWRVPCPNAEKLPPGTPPSVVLSGITKAFPGVLANPDIDLEVRRGEIHALLGENGAGKSTLMNILTGLYRPDAGEIVIDGDGSHLRLADRRDCRRHRDGSPALQAGARLHGRRKHPSWLGRNAACGRPAARTRSARTRLLAAKFNLAVDPRARVADLSAGEQQRVEILRVLVARRAHTDPRRADGGADPGGGGGAFSRAA